MFYMQWLMSTIVVLFVSISFSVIEQTDQKSLLTFVLNKDYNQGFTVQLNLTNLQPLQIFPANFRFFLGYSKPGPGRATYEKWIRG